MNINGTFLKEFNNKINRKMFHLKNTEKTLTDYDQG